MNNTIKTFIEALIQEIETFTVTPNHMKSNSSYNGFEYLVSEILENKFQNFQDIVIKENFGHYFPDIDILTNNKKYGIELKSRTDGSWNNNGGSVFESISSNDYEEIYVLFGTINKKKKEIHYQARYAPYWTVTEAIKVTHKPRYYINMNTDNSIFSSSDEYSTVREMDELEKNNYVQQVLKKSANKAQWYISDAESDAVEPTLFNSLPNEIKNSVLAEIIILFPQDLLKNRSSYHNATKYMLSTYFYYSPSVRDPFSAGGQTSINGERFPQIINRLCELKCELLEVLTQQSPDFQQKAYDSWNTLNIPLLKNDFSHDFFTVLNHCGNLFICDNLVNINTAKLSDIIFKLD